MTNRHIAPRINGIRSLGGLASICLIAAFMVGCTATSMDVVPSNNSAETTAVPHVKNAESSSLPSSDSFSTWLEQVPGENYYVEVYEKDGKIYRVDNGTELN